MWLGVVFIYMPLFLLWCAWDGLRERLFPMCPTGLPHRQSGSMVRNINGNHFCWHVECIRASLKDVGAAPCDEQEIHDYWTSRRPHSWRCPACVALRAAALADRGQPADCPACGRPAAKDLVEWCGEDPCHMRQPGREGGA